MTAIRRAAQATVFALLAAPAAQVLAANGTYTSEAAFVAVAGSTSLESFESLAARSRIVAPISAATFTITTAGAPIGVQTGADTPDAGYGAAATDGTRWLSVYLPNQPQGSITLNFASPLTAFGLNLMDVGELTGTVTLTTSAGAYAGGAILLSFPPVVGSGAVSFVGLTQDTPFSSVTITVTGVDDAYGLDKVYTTTAAVPEAPAALSLLGGLALLAARTRRRR